MNAEPSRSRKTVVHLTSVHSIEDTRIFHKQCRSLAQRGYRVVLIAPHERDETRSGVEIWAVPKKGGRLKRLISTTRAVYRRASLADADLYHFHDPELIPVGLLLKLRTGKPVIYDVHEDYETAIAQKRYLPRQLRRIFGKLVARLEALGSRPFMRVLAERYYSKRFPTGLPVLNYPLTEELSDPPREVQGSREAVRLLYTGNVSYDRGALNHAALVHLGDQVEVHVLGRCAPELAERMRQIAGPRIRQLYIVGEGVHVPYERILEAYRLGGWTAGLALFPPTPHYRDKELTKLFEYMGAGIPILCSNFPAWSSLVSGPGAGLCVDPGDSSAIEEAIAFLSEHPGERLKMGRRGREAVQNTYHWSGQSERLAALYVSLLNDRTAGSHQERP